MIKLKPGMRIKCNSEDEAKEFIRIAHKQGFKWNDDITKDDYTAWVLENSWIYYYLNADMRITYNFNVYLTDTFINYSDLKKGEYANMTKADLKNGMVVELRNGKRFLIVNDLGIGEDTYINLGGYDGYDENLNDISDAKTFDITKIYKTKGFAFKNLFDNERLSLIWEREEEKQELSKKDKKVIKKGLKKAQEYCNSLISCKDCEFHEGAYCKFDCFSMSTDLDEFFKD